jgi:malate dehydrogenase (oxaloacetate-decarboxylating)(NADP+)
MVENTPKTFAEEEPLLYH